MNDYNIIVIEGVKYKVITIKKNINGVYELYDIYEQI